LGGMNETKIKRRFSGLEVGGSKSDRQNLIQCISRSADLGSPLTPSSQRESEGTMELRFVARRVDKESNLILVSIVENELRVNAADAIAVQD